MHILLIVLLFSLLTAIQEDGKENGCSKLPNGLCIHDSLYFNRVDMANDIHKHMSIQTYGHSKESIIMNTMILFRSPEYQIQQDEQSFSIQQQIYNVYNSSNNRYHNALLIGGHIYHQYYKITKDSMFVYNNEIPIVSKGDVTMIPYTVVNNRIYWTRLTRNTFVSSGITGHLLTGISSFDQLLNDATSSSSNPSYHAILTLDKYSSIWDHYNIMSITNHQFNMHYRIGGFVYNNVDEYSGMTHLNCKSNTLTSDDNCYIEIEKLTIYHKEYTSSSHRLIIDFHSSLNYLPIDLYYYYITLRQSQRTIAFLLKNNNTDGSKGDDNNNLIINNKFNFRINEDDDDIIIGIDLLRIFSKIEYSMERNEVNVWYFEETHINYERHITVTIMLSFLILGCYYCYYDFMSSDNRRLYSILILYSNLTIYYMYFSFRQVFNELMILFLSSIILLLVLIFSDYNTSLLFQRTLLLTIICIYHCILLLTIIVKTPNVTRKAIGYYIYKDKTPDYDYNRTIINIQPSQQQQQQIDTLKKQPVISLYTRNYLQTTTTSLPLQQPFLLNNSEMTENKREDPFKDNDFDIVKEEYLDGNEPKLSKEQTTTVIMRNTSLLILIMIDVLLVINFSTEDNYLYMFLFLPLSFVLLYFMVYNLSISILYILVSPLLKQIYIRYYRRRQQPIHPFIYFVIGEILLLLLFIGWSIHCFYLDYFKLVEGIYSETFINGVVPVILILIVLLSCKRIYSNLEDNVRKKYIK